LFIGPIFDVESSQMVEEQGNAFVGMGEDRFFFVELLPSVECPHEVFGFVSIPHEQGWWGSIESSTSIAWDGRWCWVLGDRRAGCYSRHNVDVTAWLLRPGIRTYIFFAGLPTPLSRSVTSYLALYPQ
jgi:hypothetical protein